MAFTAKVITTAQWGAQPPKVPSFALRTPKYVIVHHTTNQNPPNDFSHGTREGGMELSRNIQQRHFGRGWFDSGHNFLNTTGGLVLEGRAGTVAAVKKGQCVQSAHAAQDPGLLPGGNDSPGIENEGNFMTFEMVQKQWDSLVDLCAALCAACNIKPENIRGHREFSNTQCPGDWLFSQLPRLRGDVAKKLKVELASPDDPFEIGDSGPIVQTLQAAARRGEFTWRDRRLLRREHPQCGHRVPDGSRDSGHRRDRCCDAQGARPLTVLAYPNPLF